MKVQVEPDGQQGQRLPLSGCKPKALGKGRTLWLIGLCVIKRCTNMFAKRQVDTFTH